MKRNDDDKVLPLDRWRNDRGNGGGGNSQEDNLDKLLNHMRSVRNAVPVNHDLQEKLRSHLLSMGNQHSISKAAAQTSAAKNRRPASFFMPLVAAALVVGAFIFWTLSIASGGVPEVASGPRQVARMWPAGQLSVAVGLEQEERFLAVHGGNLSLRSLSGAQHGLIEPPGEQRFLDVEVGPGPREVVLAAALPDGGTGIAISDFSTLMDAMEAGKLTQPLSFIWEDRQAAGVEGLTWSPDRKKLAFSAYTEDGGSQVYIINRQGSARVLAEGSKPCWSPDSKGLVIQRAEEEGVDGLWLVSLEGNQVYIGRGRSPAWSKEGYLFYITTRVQEKILSYTAGGLPRFTVHRPVDQVRWLHLGKNFSRVVIPEPGESFMAGSELLLVSDQSTSASERELRWLRQMELSGHEEPQVLLVERDIYYRRLLLAENDQKMYLIQDDGPTVALVEVVLGSSRGSEVERI